MLQLETESYLVMRKPLCGSVKFSMSWVLLSFDHCGITSSNLAVYSSQLRHFARTNELMIFKVGPVITDDALAFDVNHGDEWDKGSALTDSDHLYAITHN